MIELLIDGRRRDLGGFSVSRVLPWVHRRAVGPFVFLDEMGPIHFEQGVPRSADVRPHPHIGLSTVTYLFEGQITHRDSLGVKQVIEPGAVNWMTAGRGITHSERFEGLRASGGSLYGLQVWVALPVEQEECEPSFHHVPASEVPTFSPAPGVTGRLIAGAIAGLTAPLPTVSPLAYVHYELESATLDVPDDWTERALYVARGELTLGDQRVTRGQLAVLKPGARVMASSPSATVMLYAGESLGPRFIEWNFVSSRAERIAQAKHDWRAGRMALPPDDDGEFIPLP